MFEAVYEGNVDSVIRHREEGSLHSKVKQL